VLTFVHTVLVLVIIYVKLNMQLPLLSNKPVPWHYK